ncbi:MAG: hypothetical protein ABRQ26_03465 [Syntrophomonadaceae bacterium]
MDSKSFKQKPLILYKHGAGPSPGTHLGKTTIPSGAVVNMPKKELQRIPYEKLIVIAGLLK